MGSLSSSALSSLFGPVTFNGSSKFSSDFQQVLTRAVAIQGLPIQNMQNQLSILQAQQSDMSGLKTTFNSLQSAIQNLGSSVGTVSASSSDTSAVTATATSSTIPGSYTIQVLGLGSSTTTISKAVTPAVTDPTAGNISSASSFTLTINGTNTTIKPAGNSLDALASAINNAGVGVQATIVNVGSNSTTDYRLSITSNHLASDTIQLNDGTNDLLDTLSSGAPATYQVNGLNTTLQSNSAQVTLAPGLTVNLLQTTTSPVTITVGQNDGSLASGLSSLVTAYNAAVDALNAQHGQNARALAGDGTVLSLGQALTSITEYAGGSSGTTTLADLGLTLDATTGHLSLDSSVLSSANADTVQQFLGGVSSGGFLQSASNTLTALTDPTSGIIQDSLSSLQNSITNENSHISQLQEQLTTFQNNLQQRLAAADATISVLQQQVTYMGNLFATMYPNVSTSGANGHAGVSGG